MADEDVAALMKQFALATTEQRQELKMNACPVFLRRSYVLGRMRLERLNAKQLDPAAVARTVAAAVRCRMPQALPTSWKFQTWDYMSAREREEAMRLWNVAEEREVAELEVEPDGPDPRNAYGLRRMRAYMLSHMEWTCRDLHDACLAMSVAPSSCVSLLGYFNVLYAKCGSTATAFQPQQFRTHTKVALQCCLKVLSKARRLGGVTGAKSVLAERLQTVLSFVMNEGCATAESARFEGEQDADGPAEFVGDPIHRQRNPILMKATARYMAEVPEGALVDAAQAESALGHNVTDLLDDSFVAVDKDVRAEEETLHGVNVNPLDVDYTCVAFDLCSFSDEQLQSIGGPPRDLKLSAGLFETSRVAVMEVLERSSEAQRVQFVTASMSPESVARHQGDVDTLDPTQLLLVDAVRSWAKGVAAAGDGVTPVSPLRIVMLGTAGTGKTLTLKSACDEARLLFGNYDSVLKVAHTGVAAANMGGGASTIDSAFKLAGDDFSNDLDGERLSSLVEAFKHVKLVVIDEISTMSAVQFEMVHRRLEQVSKSLFREKMNMEPPECMGGFGGLGVLLVGDFGQLPPVAASSLIARSSFESCSSGLRGRADAGHFCLVVL
jgi:DNA replication protein DnaC